MDNVELEVESSKPLIRPLQTTQWVAKWGTAILLHKDLACMAKDITPVDNWAKGQISTVTITTNETPLTIISVYAPAQGTKEKQVFYAQLTEWTKTIQGEKLIGGDWNMTLDQSDQKMGKYKKDKNIPLHTFHKEAQVKDVWKKMNRRETPSYMWKRGDGLVQ
jgi:exonuclease III